MSVPNSVYPGPRYATIRRDRITQYAQKESRSSDLQTCRSFYSKQGEPTLERCKLGKMAGCCVRLCKATYAQKSREVALTQDFLLQTR